MSSRADKKTLHLGADKKNDPFTSSSIKQAGLEVGKKLEFKQTLIRASSREKGQSFSKRACSFNKESRVHLKKSRAFKNFVNPGYVIEFFKI